MAGPTNEEKATRDASAGERLRARFAAALEDALRAAAAHGSDDTSTRAEAIRRFRKALKAARAVLPLLESTTASESFDGVKRALSDAGGIVSPVRDRDAMLRTIERLFSDADQERARQARSLLVAAVRLPESDVDAREFEDRLLVRATGIVALVAQTARSFDYGAVRADEVARTIAKRWRRARKLSVDVWDSDDSEELHELRKRSSRLALQLQLFPERATLQDLRKRLRGVTTALGDEHDLAMLAERISLARASFSSEDLVEAALALARKARERLCKDARRAASKAFRTRPRELRREISRAFS